MPYFWRSLKYLWPYRWRLAGAVLCVIAIASLWGGGIGLVLPGAKILLSPEGLHGWAYATASEDHLGARIVEQEPPGRPADIPRDVDQVAVLASVTPDGPAGTAGLKNGDWIVGVNGRSVERSRDVIRKIGLASPGEALNLNVYSPNKGLHEVSGVVMGSEKPTTRVLKFVATHIPEPRNMAERFTLFCYLLLTGLVITLVRGVFTFLQEYLVGMAIWLGIMDLRCENYNVVLHLPMTYFSEKGVSDATSRFVQDTGSLARGQNTLLGKTLVEPAKAVSALALALMCSWQLTLMVLVAGPPSMLLIRKLGKKMHRAAKRTLEGWSNMLAVLNETLMGIRVVKAYTMEGSERKRFFRVNRKLMSELTRMQRLDTASGPAIESLGICAGTVAAGVAGYLVFVGYTWDGQVHMLKSETFLAWIITLFAMFDPMRKLAKVITRFHESDAAAQRIFELMDSKQEPHVPNAPTLPRHKRDIEFRHVSYRYPAAAVNAVEDFSLTVRAGQRVAIVGPNGSGKTTLVSMLPRLIDPSSGSIFIDGINITQCSIRSLRRQIGLVTQDTVMFHATIGENIAYGLRRPRQDAVLAASKKAYVDEFVRELPAGYDTMVGEHGATLSGGQKQRIAIARAILRDPAILIFDEAMSQVDSDSEHRISLAMEEFIKGRTTFLIAHRFATVLSADLIVVMDAGRIVATGTHKELVDSCELYGHLYRTQFIDSGG